MYQQRSYDNDHPLFQTQTLRKIYPWVIIALSAIFMFYKYVLQVSPSIMADDLMRAFNVSGAGLGNLAACYFYSFLIMQIPVGIILDHFGPRYLSTFAIAICATGIIIFAYTDSLFVASLARAAIGFGAAFATISFLKLAACWFPPERFSLLAGLLATSAMLGAVGGQSPLAFLVEHAGWQRSLIYFGIAGIIFAFLYYSLVRNQPANYVEPLHNKMHTEPFFSGLWTVLKNPQNWLLSLYSGLAFAPTDVFAGLWGVPFLMEAYHIPRTTAAAAASCVFIGLAIGAPVFGWISDRLGKRKIVAVVGTLVAFVGAVVAIYVPNLPLLVLGIFLFLFGFGTGSFMLGFVIGKEINKLALAATVIAVINTSDALWGAISEPLIGKFLDLGWDGTMLEGARIFSVTNYRWSLSILLVYLALAILILFFIRDSATKQKQ